MNLLLFSIIFLFFSFFFLSFSFFLKLFFSIPLLFLFSLYITLTPGHCGPARRSSCCCCSVVSDEQQAASCGVACCAVLQHRGLLDSRWSRSVPRRGVDIHLQFHDHFQLSRCETFFSLSLSHNSTFAFLSWFHVRKKEMKIREKVNGVRIKDWIFFSLLMKNVLANEI